MQLKDFVSETISQVMLGVSAAIKSHDVKNLGGIINPFPASLEHGKGMRQTQIIEFDVAVTVEEGQTLSKDGGVHIKVVEASLSKDVTKKTVGESRVKFSVPVSLPYTTVQNA